MHFFFTLLAIKIFGNIVSSPVEVYTSFESDEEINHGILNEPANVTRVIEGQSYQALLSINVS